MKNIAIFSDGTWNSPEEDHPTNVLMLARSVSPTNNVGVHQVAFYDWGVGTDRKELTGGATGAGINKNIQDCYRFLVHNYNPGDRIYLFGFSRGAYTVRSLAGFIRNCGLVKREHSSKIKKAYTLYRSRTKGSHPDKKRAKTFRQKYAVEERTPIEFVGVWDTVGALGVPVPFFGTLGEDKYLFHDTSPSSIIKTLRHAASIDENREDFQVTPCDPSSTTDFKEVWFAGVHSDVGGSYKVHGLSDIACKWMIDQAEKAEIQFEPHLKTWLDPKPGAEMHEERKGLYSFRGELVRDITGPVHKSVKKRWDKDTDSYRSRSKALEALLASKGNDWGQIEIEP